MKSMPLLAITAAVFTFASAANASSQAGDSPRFKFSAPKQVPSASLDPKSLAEAWRNFHREKKAALGEVEAARARVEAQAKAEARTLSQALPNAQVLDLFRRNGDFAECRVNEARIDEKTGDLRLAVSSARSGNKLAYLSISEGSIILTGRESDHSGQPTLNFSLYEDEKVVAGKEDRPFRQRLIVHLSDDMSVKYMEFSYTPGERVSKGQAAFSGIDEVSGWCYPKAQAETHLADRR